MDPEIGPQSQDSRRVLAIEILAVYQWLKQMKSRARKKSRHLVRPSGVGRPDLKKYPWFKTGLFKRPKQVGLVPKVGCAFTFHRKKLKGTGSDAKL
jgi:hypothetical protein